MQVNPERLLVLHAVAEAGGIVAAGRRLNLVPSGISAHIAALERETGVVVLDRSRRGGRRPAQLTAAGHAMLVHARQLVEVLADTEATVRELVGQVDGPVVLAAFPTVITGLAVPALACLADTHPGILPVVRELNQDDAISAVHAGDVDIAIVEHDEQCPQADQPGLQIRWLLDDPYRLAIPSTWPVPATLHDLDQRVWVDGPPGSAVRQSLDRLRTAHQLALRGVHSCLEFPSVLALVAGGLAAALVPDLALAPSHPVRTRIVDLPDLGARRISAVYRHQKTGPAPAIAAMLHTLTDAAHPTRLA